MQYNNNNKNKHGQLCNKNCHHEHMYNIGNHDTFFLVCTCTHICTQWCILSHVYPFVRLWCNHWRERKKKEKKKKNKMVIVSLQSNSTLLLLLLLLFLMTSYNSQQHPLDICYSFHISLLFPLCRWCGGCRVTIAVLLSV